MANQDKHKLRGARHNKPLIWWNKEVKSKYHNNKIMALTDWETMRKSKNGPKNYQAMVAE